MALAAADSPTTKVYGVEIPPLIMNTPYGSTGIIVDVVKTAFKRANLNVEIEVVPWARGFAFVKEGEGDALIPTIRSAEREALFDFPDEPVFRSEMSFFRSAQAPIAWTGKLAELQGRSFVKLRAALFAPEFDQAVRDGRIKCEETNSFSSAIRMVDANRVELAAVPKLTGLQIIASEGLQGKVVALEPAAFTQPFFLAFARRPALGGVRKLIDAKLAEMWRDGTITAIVDDYRRRNWIPPAR
ncbi:transporter substrate-binding domain-containing protein [Niveibacterium umoris]